MNKDIKIGDCYNWVGAIMPGYNEIERGNPIIITSFSLNTRLLTYKFMKLSGYDHIIDEITLNKLYKYSEKLTKETMIRNIIE